MEKKLHKSSADKALFGVCGGIAEYFDIDSLIIRLLFVIVALVFGSGILLYIILALVMPTEADLLRRQARTAGYYVGPDGTVYSSPLRPEKPCEPVVQQAPQFAKSAESAAFDEKPMVCAAPDVQPAAAPDVQSAAASDVQSAAEAVPEAKPAAEAASEAKPAAEAASAAAAGFFVNQSASQKSGEYKTDAGRVYVQPEIKKHPASSNPGIALGLILIAFGALIALKEFFPAISFSLVFAGMLIAAGLIIIIRRK